MRRRFSKRQRRALLLASGGRCALCKTSLPRNFHADHRVPFSRGGPTILENAQPLCGPCNMKKGASIVPSNISLREWQSAAHDKAVNHYLTADDARLFLINAAPGAGKTLLACSIARTLIDKGAIDRVVVLAPRVEVVSQFSEKFADITGRPMSSITSADDDLHGLGLDISVTWAAIQGLQDAFQMLCSKARTLVICDEHHHAAAEASWGRGVQAAFDDAAHVLVLTGTPHRSDGGETAWLAEAFSNKAGGPADDASYTLTYGQAVNLGYCCAATFHRHTGRFKVVFGPDQPPLVISSDDPSRIENHPASAALQRAVSFHNLAMTPVYSAGQPALNGYHASMVRDATAALDALRKQMSNAGGLVIAPSIAMAEYFADLIYAIDGERPVIVHSDVGGAAQRIKAFRRSDKRWIVSVAMISEGVDIPRLRVLIYLPSAMTELAFRQAIGRVVRTIGSKDHTRAYVVMPALETLDVYAKRIEEEMPAHIRKVARGEKSCPSCNEVAEVGTANCRCGYEFPTRRIAFVSCSACNKSNPASATSCNFCGDNFAQEYTVKLDEASRGGAIVRGHLVSEGDVRESERLAANLVAAGLDDDPTILELRRLIPPELMGAAYRLLSKYGEAAMN